MNPLLFVKAILKKLKECAEVLSRINERFDEININQGRILSQLNSSKQSKVLQDYEFKVFSQWGDDGILQKLINSIEIKNKTFIEFGIEDFTESNCRFLMMKDNWAGFVVDGSSKNIERLKSSYFYWKYELQATCAFITKENINDLLKSSGFDGDLGILSVDIDGVDYFVLESIVSFSPRIMVLEFNSLFGAERKITVPYTYDFNKTKKHYSNLYYGASLPAMVHLATTKGYTFVGTNSAGENAFFVRNDLMNGSLNVYTAKSGFTLSKVRESRDAMGRLTFVAGESRFKQIQGLPVFNIETGQIETL